MLSFFLFLTNLYFMFSHRLELFFSLPPAVLMSNHKRMNLIKLQVNIYALLKGKPVRRAKRLLQYCSNTTGVTTDSKLIFTSTPH